MFGPAIDDRHVLAFDIARVLQAAVKSAQAVQGCLSRDSVEKSNHRHRRLLRARRQRPCGGRAAPERDELAAFPPVTSRARASSVGGISRPSNFAVCRLITSSNLVARTTGKSVGFAPLRMRPT